MFSQENGITSGQEVRLRRVGSRSADLFANSFRSSGDVSASSSLLDGIVPFILIILCSRRGHFTSFRNQRWVFCLRVDLGRNNK